LPTLFAVILPLPAITTRVVAPDTIVKTPVVTVKAIDITNFRPRETAADTVDGRVIVVFVFAVLYKYSGDVEVKTIVPAPIVVNGTKALAVKLAFALY